VATRWGSRPDARFFAVAGHFLALHSIEQARIEEGLKYLERARRLDPSNSLLVVASIQVLKSLGEGRRASRMGRRARIKWPEDPSFRADCSPLMVFAKRNVDSVIREGIFRDRP
jgi:hypothetical protein